MLSPPLYLSNPHLYLAFICIVTLGIIITLFYIMSICIGKLFHINGTSGGLTVILDSEGKPIITKDR